MARIKYSALVSGVAGSVGGATFQNGAYGNVLRSKPRHRLSGSALQMTRRSQMMAIHTAWRNLSDANRSAWNHFLNYSNASIRRDKSVLQTGHSLFIQYNYLRLITGAGLMSTIGYTPLKELPQIAYIFNNVGVLNVEFSTQFTQTISWFTLHLSLPRLAHVAASSVGCRYMNVTFATGQTFNLTTAWSAIFGALPVNGDTLHYVLRHFSITSPVVSGIYVGKLVMASPP
jgi:hypothetical protein